MIGWTAAFCLGLGVTAGAPSPAAAVGPAPGRTRIVHLWASWCRPCVAELPHLIAALSRLKKVEVLFVSLDGRESAARARSLVKPRGAIRTLAGDPALVAALRELDPEWDGELPTTYLWSRAGERSLAQRGFTDLPELLRALSPPGDGS
jgi:thiol-disulfide isomerase/thioredoxin